MSSHHRFHFRLITLLICILVMGITIGANLTEDSNYNYEYGWPFLAVYKNSWALWDRHWVWIKTSIFWNVVFAVIIVFDAGYISELLSRRSDAAPRTRPYLPALLCVLIVELLLYPVVMDNFEFHRSDAILTFGPTLFAVWAFADFVHGKWIAN